MFFYYGKKIIIFFYICYKTYYISIQVRTGTEYILYICD